MDHREELFKQVSQLLSALKQIMKSGGQTSPLSWVDSDGRNITLNICFCNFFSGDEDDYESWDSTIDDASSWNEAAGMVGDEDGLKFEITHRDRDFLDTNGISF